RSRRDSFRGFHKRIESRLDLSLLTRVELLRLSDVLLNPFDLCGHGFEFVHCERGVSAGGASLGLAIASRSRASSAHRSGASTSRFRTSSQVAKRLNEVSQS